MKRTIAAVFLIAASAMAQTPKDVRAAAKPGTSAIPTVAGYLNSKATDTRVETVKQLIAIGGKDTIDPLIKATHDNDGEVQIRAIDGLVNYYLPGYVRQGPASSLIRAGAGIKAKFSDSNDQVIDSFVIVRPDVITALGALARGGANFDVRSAACRAIGILRGGAALPDLVDALGTHDNGVMYESLAAMEKIRDPAAGPKIIFLLRDLDDKVQVTAIETVGLLRTTEALPSLRGVVARPRNIKGERAALAAIAMMPEPGDRDLFRKELAAKDDKVRAAAAEGLGRIGNPADQDVLDKTWLGEDKMLPRLGAAFGLLLNGKVALTDESPFRYLINTLNSSAYRDVAYAYLTEAARRKPVLDALYFPMEQGTRDEKIYLSRVLAASGDQSSVPYLDKMSRDTDTDVAQEGLRALRSLRARLGT